MNERIQELWEKTTQCVWPKCGKYSSVSCDNIEGYSKALIMECIDALWTKDCNYSDHAAEEFHRGSEKIKRHFSI